MKNYFITESTTSVESFSKSFEFLISNSKVTTKTSSDTFKSFGDGIISNNFYIGNNHTENLDEIEVQNSDACILSIPKVGHYSTKISNQSFHDFTSESGGIILPVDKVLYKANTDIVDDLIIIISMEDLKPILEKNYDIRTIDKRFLKLVIKNEKVSSVRNFIESTLQTAKNFPHIRESLLVKTNLKEIATLLMADLVADSLKIPPITVNSPDSILVKRAEEYIENECGNLFTIQEIANYLFTSPRSLQKAFKRHRDYSPMQFLKNRKLKRAHKLLLTQNSINYTVKQVALSAGILDLNRFSKYYFELFGELPSNTLDKVNK